jgi:hypothetical protein
MVSRTLGVKLMLLGKDVDEVGVLANAIVVCFHIV